MKRFEFRLESLVNLRRATEEAAKRAFGVARTAEERQATEVKRFEDAERRAVAELRGAQATGEVRVAELLAHQRHLGALARRVAAEKVRLGELKGEVTKTRAALVAAARDRKALDRLRERRLAEWTVEMLKDEQRALDEASSAARMAGGWR
ncbi:MAG: flagellar export protein FliJ [Planctomycetes bacterium]|nr:flagellar export protein FliJ [Planctomycetota bacterium]